jgi:regulatory LuxR family protein
MLARGLPMKEVGRRLHITARTVAFHKYTAMQALGLRSNVELIAFTQQSGGGLRRRMRGTPTELPPPRRWEVAGAARVTAQAITDPPSRKALFKIAAGYDQLAARAASARSD